MRAATFLLFALCFAMLAPSGTRAGESTESEKRTEFAKAMASAKPEDRVAAIQILKGAKEDASLRLLGKAAVTDAADSVRLSAFQAILEWPDPLGKLEAAVLEIFRNEKNRATKVAMAQGLPTLKTKAAVIEEVIHFFCKLAYPEEELGSATKNPARWEAEEAVRMDYRATLDLINTLTGQGFIVTSSPKTESKKWWALHRNEFIKADIDTLARLRKEARDAATTKR